MLTLERSCRRLELLVRLPPGSNVAVLWEPERNCWCWHRELWHTCFNQA